MHVLFTVSKRKRMRLPLQWESWENKSRKGWQHQRRGYQQRMFRYRGKCNKISDDDIDLGDWDYEIVDLKVATKYPRQACFNIRGVSYIPPGWKWVYKWRKCPLMLVWISNWWTILYSLKFLSNYLRTLIFLKLALADIIDEVEHLKESEVEGMTFSISYYLGGDWKFLAVVTGICRELNIFNFSNFLLCHFLVMS